MKENMGKRAFCGHSEEGSIIVVALMVLAIISVIGVMATETVVTENYIIRNVAIHKQNVNLAEGAIMEGIQTARMLDPVSQMNPNSSSTDWINSDEDSWTQEDWYDNCAIRLLDANNSIVPQMVSNDNTGSISILEERGEDDSQNLRIAFVGWDVSSGASLKSAKPSRKTGRLLGEYASDQFGMVRMEVGFERVF